MTGERQVFMVGTRTGVCLYAVAFGLALLVIRVESAPIDKPVARPAACEDPTTVLAPRFATHHAPHENPFLRPAGWTQQATDAGQATRPYVGFRTCLRCHNTGVEGTVVELPGGGKLDLKDDQWVLYKEYPIWAKEDKHGQAYTVLLNARSKKMGELLGIAEVHRDKRCLACHSGFPLEQMTVEKGDLVSPELAKNLDVNLGVSCEGCHGPAGDLRKDDKTILKGWRAPHEIQPVVPYEKTQPWRFLAPETKLMEYGFWDVRSPAPRTQICASCHVGSVEQGRIVTHEMYAAGHPPLPSFEIETFTEQMPRHWREFSTKAEKVIDEFLKYSKDPLYREASYKKDNLQRTRSLLVGALVTSSEYLKMLGQLANEGVRSPVKRSEWPELAVFDCYACHHDLKNLAWRQQRKPPVGTPGRPPMQEWNAVLVRRAVQTAGGSAAELDARMKPVRDAVGSQPFGNQGEVRKTAAAAAAWLRSVANDMQKKPLAREDGLGLLQDIARVASSDVLDYEPARQCVWAIRVIDGEVKTANSAKIQAMLAALEKDMFLLNLRSGRKAATAVPGDKQERATVEVDLEITLPFVANYDPARFRERFREIAALLK